MNSFFAFMFLIRLCPRYLSWDPYFLVFLTDRIVPIDHIVVLYIETFVANRD